MPSPTLAPAPTRVMRRRTARRRGGRLRARAAVAVLAALVLAGCGGASEDAAPPVATQSQDPTAALAARCSEMVPSDAPMRSTQISARPAAVFEAEEPRAVMVLLHQPGTAGLCGWGWFAAAAAQRGISAVAIDLCPIQGDGCTPNAASLPRVRPAVQFARGLPGGERVVLVGAGTGGTLAVSAVANGLDVDGWADVSGASPWRGTELEAQAAGLAQSRLAGVRGLVVASRTDGMGRFRTARALARGAGVEFVGMGAGHGYDLLVRQPEELGPLGLRVLGFVAPPRASLPD